MTSLGRRADLDPPCRSCCLAQREAKLSAALIAKLLVRDDRKRGVIPGSHQPPAQPLTHAALTVVDDSPANLDRVHLHTPNARSRSRKAVRDEVTSPTRSPVAFSYGRP